MKPQAVVCRWGRSGPPVGSASPVALPVRPRAPRSFYSRRGLRVKSAAAVLLLAFVPLLQGGDLEKRLRMSRQEEELLAHLSELYQQGEYEQVLAELGAAGIPEPSPRLENLHGMSLAALGRHRDAVVAYERGLRRALHLPELHLNLAIVLLELGMTGRAMAEFDEAVRLAPADPEARLGLGRSLLRFGRLDAAAEQLEMADRLAPGEPRILRARAELADASEDRTASVALWTELERIQPDADSARRLAEFERVRDPERALALLDSCARRDPEATDCAMSAAALWLERGEPGLAVSRLRDVQQRQALPPGALHNLLLALHQLERIDELEKIVGSQPPAEAASWGVVALARRLSKRPEAALDAVRRGRELAPEDLELANLEGVLLAELGRIEEARELWRWILQRHPDHADARANLRAHPSG